MQSAKDKSKQISGSVNVMGLDISGQNNYYQDIIEAALDMIFIHDSEGKITYINDFGIKESGYTENELLNLNPIKLVPPEYYGIMEELQIKRLNGNREVLSYEMEYLKKNGERIPVRLSSSPIYKNDTLEGVIHIVRNMSELKKAEKILGLQTELASKLCQTNTLHSALDEVLSTALEIGDVDCGGIYIFDEKTHDFNLECFRNLSNETLAYTQSVSSKTKIKSGPLFVVDNDFTNGINSEMLDILRNKEKLKFFSILPFSHMGKSIGSLNIGSHVKGDIPEISKKILVALSQEIGGTISRIKSEESLKDSENNYRQLVESANSIISKFDKNGVILSINEFGASFFGYTKDEIIGKSMHETIIPEFESTGRGLKTLINDICANEKDYKVFINENVKKNGEKVWIYWANKPIFDKNGNLTAVLSIGNDITEQKKMEEKIKQSEIKFKTLFEKAYEPIFILDQDLFIRDTNSTSVELFNYPKEKIIGMSLYELIAPIETKKLQHVLRNEFDSSNLFMETNFIKKNGRIFPAEINLNSLDMQGEKSIICTIRDITEQKKKEDELKKQILKYDLNEGNVYLSKESSNLLPFEAFRELVDIGYSGTLISRSEKENFDIEDIEFDYFWLSSRSGPNTVSPDIRGLKQFISNIKNKNVVLLDSIDYLIAKNGFNEVYNFISEIREMAYFGNNTIILSVDKDTVEPRQLKLIEKETKQINLKSVDSLNNRMVDIINYILNQNKLGINPSYSSIGKEILMTRPTVRKNVRLLEANKYVIVHRKGRNKTLEITEKGKKLL